MGAGYVGLSVAVLLSQTNDVFILDVDPERVEKVNRQESTVEDADIDLFLKSKSLKLKATLDPIQAYKDAEYIVVATPTNYDPTTNRFNTSSVDNVIEQALTISNKATIIIKSTIPVGHTRSLQRKLKTNRVFFCPEFLREGKALHDNLFPSRIVLGCTVDEGFEFAQLLVRSSNSPDVKVLYMSPTEAEAVKLFANTYLAMRISFFNELDSYAMTSGLDTANIIEGICFDKRIGHGYNNPSFGYGGYCLPKDTKQLLANYNTIPQNLIQAIVSSNTTRKNYIADTIIELKPKTVGIYRLVMKQDSDNFRSSAVQDIIKRLHAKGIELLIFEPNYPYDTFLEVRVTESLDEFKNLADIVITNRWHADLDDVSEKVFTRDIYGTDA